MTSEDRPLELRDCDLVLGRDVPRDRWANQQALRESLAVCGITGGLVGSLRAAQFDVVSGNDEVAGAVDGMELRVCPVLDLRDLLGAEREIDRWEAAGHRVFRLCPARQAVEPGYPTFPAIARRLASAGHTILTEGDVRTVSTPLRDLGARVVFLDLHFYHLGDFIALCREEPGFHGSTRLLSGPDSLEILTKEVGPDRLLFGSRSPLHEASSVLLRLATSRLSGAEKKAVASGNFHRLVGLP